LVLKTGLSAHRLLVHREAPGRNEALGRGGRHEPGSRCKRPTRSSRTSTPGKARRFPVWDRVLMADTKKVENPLAADLEADIDAFLG
jgi:hypothetical protein